MSNVSEWSTSAGSNNDAPPDGAPEGMLPGKVNDVIRENMAAGAKWYQDQNGSLVTAGTGAAYTLATNSSYGALSDIPLLLFRTHTANTGACTLNVDGLGAKPLRRNSHEDDYAAGEIASGQTLVVAYNSGTDDFDVIGPAVANEAIPVGTAMLFVQTAAPTGWTKGVTHNDKALRLVTGTASSGGTTAFTSVFTSRTILQANLPDVDLILDAGFGLLLPSTMAAAWCVRSTTPTLARSTPVLAGMTCFDDLRQHRSVNADR